MLRRLKPIVGRKAPRCQCTISPLFVRLSENTRSAALRYSVSAAMGIAGVYLRPPGRGVIPRPDSITDKSS
jgi:hypothetical protein